VYSGIARNIRLAADSLIILDYTYLSTIQKTKQLTMYAGSNRASRSSRQSSRTRSRRPSARGYSHSISGKLILWFFVLATACIAVFILIKRSLKKKEGTKMKQLSGKMRLAVFLSSIWFIVVLIGFGGIAIGERLNEFEFFIIFLSVGILPLLISWGIWWIKQGFKKDKRI